MTIFAGMNTIPMTEKGNYIKPGVYDVEVYRCKALEPNLQRAQPGAFVAEFKITRSNNADHPAGSLGTWFQGFKYRESAGSALKQFVTAVLGPEYENQVEQVLAEATGPENSLAGMPLHIEAWATTTKAGGQFTRYKFTPLEGATRAPPAAATGTAAMPPPPPAAAPMPVSPDGKWKFNGKDWIPNV